MASDTATPIVANINNELEHFDHQETKPLAIPIRSSNINNIPIPQHYVEIFPEEIPSIPSSTVSNLLMTEDAPLQTWTHAALLYMQQKKDSDSTFLLSTACSELLEKRNLGSREEKVRCLAAAGIGYLTQAQKGALNAVATTSNTNDIINTNHTNNPNSNNNNNANPSSKGDEEYKSMADNHFTRATKVDQLFPMTWIGKGMLSLYLDQVDRAEFFFKTTLEQCGNVLPALLGKACVKFKQGDYETSQELYAQAMTLFPIKSGSAARVGFGLTCYKLGQMDRAKAAFKRAYEMDSENVNAMIGIAILDMANLDETLTKDYRSKIENAIKLISMANLIDHSNAMVQNHLANHYFWKWTPVPGVVVDVERGSCVVRGDGPVNLDPGERIRIGHEFETSVLDDDDEEQMGSGGMDLDSNLIRIKDAWNAPSAKKLKLWKKDYDRVIALAKGAFSSTTVKEIQAESLYLLARVYHIRDDMINAHQYYERACKLAPDLTPARFGLAQTLIWDETYDEAAAHLRLVLGMSSNATDAHAALGLLEVQAGKDRRRSGFSYLKKAIDLDPLNPDLILLEAIALQQQESDYSVSLDRYKKAVSLMEEQGRNVSWEVWTNMGVLCHETDKYDEAAVNYNKALEALDELENVDNENKDKNKDPISDNEDCITHNDNRMFWDYVDTGLQVSLDKSSGNGLRWKIKNDSNNVMKVSDHIRVGNEFESIISSISDGEIIVKNQYHSSNADADTEPEIHNLYVKKTNQRLANHFAISVTFNLARLHEAAGRIIPAVELHKAILKRHPSYVNSYLRLACIARDCGSLEDCANWLTSGYAVAPDNPEVLTLVGNLHLSLCDWQHAQSVFDQLLQQKVPNVEAYSMLCLGNIYFNNLKTPNKYSKHLQYAADWYKRILNRDKANAYAANGIGTVLAEKGEIIKAKEVFNRVREISGDTIHDALLNLGHIYLAFSKHPEALQMYHSYMTRTRGSGAQSKSRDDDNATVLFYISFAYFDWARQTEMFNNAKAEPADGRYKKCIEFLELAMKTSKKENIVYRYNWCMAKLHAANCVLQKLTRNIRRTAQEVQDALDGLQESLPKVQMMVQWKKENKKVPISTSTLNDFITLCKANIESAKSHLSQELKKEAEAREFRAIQMNEALLKQKENEIKTLEKKEREAREREERERKAQLKMQKVNNLVLSWEQDAKAKEEAVAKRKAGKSNPEADDVDDMPVADESDEDNVPDKSGDESNEERPSKSQKVQQSQLFGDDSDDDDVFEERDGTSSTPAVQKKDLFGESDDDSDDDEVFDDKADTSSSNPPVQKADLFGESDDDSDGSDKGNAQSSKRDNTELGTNGTEGRSKRRRLSDDDSS